MLEGLLYELLPVVGFGVCVSAIFVIVVMRKEKHAFKFTLYLAATDFLLGLSTIFGGFRGVLVTIYDGASEEVSPFDCIFRAVNVPFWVFSDILHSLILSLFAFDRLLQMLVPVSYTRVSRFYLNWISFSILCGLSLPAISPSLQYAIVNRDNSSITVSPLCRFNEVVGTDYYFLHLMILQWTPIGGIAILSLAFILFCIRQTRHRWTYNWSEEAAHTTQLGLSCLVRCIITAASIHLSLLTVTQYSSDEYNALRDFLVRISFSVAVPILQPLWYLLAMPQFQLNTKVLFNQYGQNTKRDWQSAADPPRIEDEHQDPHGDRNPFGSWYSSTGNVTGEAGVPIEERAGKEKSVSFYYDREELEMKKDKEKKEAQRKETKERALNGETQRKKRGASRHSKSSQKKIVNQNGGGKGGEKEGGKEGGKEGE